MMRTGFSNLQGDEDEMQHRHAKALIDICKPVFETAVVLAAQYTSCLLYTSPSPRDGLLSRMPSSA